MLQLVSSNEWTLLNQKSTEGIEMYHKSYGNNLHGVVFVDDEGGNSILLDSENNILDMKLSSMCDYSSLQKVCDTLTTNIIKAV